MFAKKEDMPIYLVKMVPKVKEPGVQAMLNTLQGTGWASDGDSEEAVAADPDGRQLQVPEVVLQKAMEMVQMASAKGGDDVSEDD